MSDKLKVLPENATTRDVIAALVTQSKVGNVGMVYAAIMADISKEPQTQVVRKLTATSRPHITEAQILTGETVAVAADTMLFATQLALMEPPGKRVLSPQEAATIIEQTGTYLANELRASSPQN